jgi:predicted esterase
MVNALRARGSELLLVAAAMCCATACEGEETPAQITEPAREISTVRPDAPLPGCEAMINDSACDKTKRPIVFVHGTTANGESFAHQALLFASNGYCPERIRAVEYHSLVMLGGAATALPVRSLDAGVAAAADAGPAPAMGLDWNETYRRAEMAIDEAIEQLRKETGFDKVDLLGHSQGGAHTTRYAREHPEKVAHYVNFAGGDVPADPSGVPTLCLSSTGDRVLKCGTTRNVVFQDDKLDHAAVSSSTESFVETYKFLVGEPPKFTEVQCGDKVVLEGRAPTFGDNTFLPGAKIEVYELGDAPRGRGEPVKVFDLDPGGNFGPWEAKRNTPYEFKMVPPPGDTRRPRHAYLPGFIRSDRLLRFNFESRDPVASGTGSQVRYGDDHAVMVVRRRQKAFLYGRDSLKIDGLEVITEENSRRGAVTCALYLYDGPPGDRQSTAKSIVKARFVDSADVFMPAMTPAYVTVAFNGKSLRIPNWRSDSEGMSLVLVD